MEQKARILVVEDEAIVAEDLAMAMSEMGYEVAGRAVSAEEAVKKARELMPDLILMDIVLKGKKNGIDASREIKTKMDIPILFLTAYSDVGLMDRAKSIEPYAYIIKPFQERQLLASIEMALYKSRMEKKLKEREGWLSTTLRSIGDGVIATDSRGCVTLMNPVAEALTGWKQAEAVGKPVKDVFHIISEETGKPAEDPVTKVIREGVVVGLANHTLLIAKDGTKLPIDDSGAPIRDDKGNVLGVVLVFHDITERKRAEKLKASTYRISEETHAAQNLEELFRSIHTLISDLMPVKNNFYIALYDEATGEIRFPYFVYLYDEPPAPRTRGRGLTEYVLRTEEPQLVSREELEELVKQGEIEITGTLPVCWLGIPLKTQEKVIGVLAVQSYTEDIRFGEEDKNLLMFVSEQVAMAILHKQAGDALRRSEEQYRTMIEHSNDMIWTLDTQGNFTYFNKRSEEISGYKLADWLGKSFSPLVLPEDLPGIQKVFQETIAGKSRQYEVHIYKKDGSILVLSVNTAPIYESGEIIGTVSFGRDITERKRMAEALQFERAQLLSIFDSIDEIIYVADPNTYEILYANKALREAFGKSLVGGICYREFQGFESPCAFCTNEIIFKEKNKPYQWEYHNPILDRDLMILDRVIKWPDGRDVRFEWATDVTEQKHLEEHLRQAQKMESIGTLAGGVAHDFNNILTIIQGHIELALRGVREDEPLYRTLGEVLKASKRAANLTSQLLLFSRRKPMERIPLDLNGLIQDMTKMLNRLIGEEISLTSDLASDLWTIEGDPGTIEQVIMNLVVNARDAMPGGGDIFIRTRNVQVDRKYCREHSYARPGRFECLSVRDTGVGMDQATIDRIFEPFFSTKGLGKGTGLGLSVVYGIIKQHRGWITVESAPGEGALFRIYFPAVSTKPLKPGKAPVSSEAFTGWGERILVVEDDVSILNFLTEVLSKNGYAVFGAGTAQEALELFEQEAGNFDLLFCDVVLPDGRSPELVERLLERKPGIRVLFTSGYSEKKSDWRTIQEKGVPYLQKPYLLSDLLRAVRDAMKKP